MRPLLTAALCSLCVSLAHAEESLRFKALVEAACKPHKDDFVYLELKGEGICWRIIDAAGLKYRLEWRQGLLTVGRREEMNSRWVIVDSEEKVREGYAMEPRNGVVLYTMHFRGEGDPAEWSEFYDKVAAGMCLHLKLRCGG